MFCLEHFYFWEDLDSESHCFENILRLSLYRLGACTALSEVKAWVFTPWLQEQCCSGRLLVLAEVRLWFGIFLICHTEPVLLAFCALNSRQLRVWLRAQLLFLLKPQTCSLCWHLRVQVASLECWPETSLGFPTFPLYAWKDRWALLSQIPEKQVNDA